MPQSSSLPFSRRFGFEPEEPEITIRNDAPADLRFALVALAKRGGLHVDQLLGLFTQTLLVAPEGNWSPSYIEQEVKRLIQSAPWPLVYNCAEEIYLELKRRFEFTATDPAPHLRFETELNSFLRQKGIGWQLSGGHIEFRGPPPLEAEVLRATDALTATSRRTAANELAQSRNALSRRPDPDVTGAIQHALASLECLSRDIVGDPRVTFGDLIKRNPTLFPKPLDEAMNKLWGYASEFARHLREGRDPTLPEAILIVGLAASVESFLLERERMRKNI